MVSNTGENAMSQTTTFAPAVQPVPALRENRDLRRRPHTRFVTPLLTTEQATV